MSAQPFDDVRAHVHRPDLAREHGFEARKGAESACPGAPAGARVPHLRLVDQGTAPNPEPYAPPPPPRGGLGAALAEELRAAQAQAAASAAGSDWAVEAMTPVLAWTRLAPAKGEAANWIIWTVMTAAGLCRALWNSAGYLVVKGTDTRIKAGVATGVLLIALGMAYLAGHSA